MLKKLLLTFAGVVVAVLAGAMLLPRMITVTRSVVINAPPDRIYALVATPREWPTWSAWNKRDPNMAITFSGPPTGAGAKWEWKSASEGDGSMVFTAATPPTRVEFELQIVGMGPPSTGTFTLKPSGSATEIEWTMVSDMGAGPVGRLFGLYFPSMLKKDFDAGLGALKTRAEQAAPPSS
jgi:uncharacterized protein YndB with AHSA1/START domain